MRDNVPPERWQEFRDDHAKTLYGQMEQLGEALAGVGRAIRDGTPLRFFHQRLASEPGRARRLRAGAGPHR